MPSISRKTWTLCAFDRAQLIFLSAFLLINVVLFSFAEHTRPYPEGPLISPTYLSAADGQRYWGVAISLAEKKSFAVPPLWDSRPEYPLARSGPLPAIIFSIPIKLVGLERAAALIVVFQCILLYAMSIFSRTLATPFGVSKNLLQGLILFNPNLIGLSHLAQSDLMFSVVFTIFFCYLTGILSQPKQPSLKAFLICGALLALVTMIRDIGYLFSVFFPVLFLITIALAPQQSRSTWRRILTGLLCGTLVYVLLVLPWSVRNQVTFNQLSPVVGQIEQLHYNYSRIKYLEGGNSPDERSTFINTRIVEILIGEGQEHCVEYELLSYQHNCQQEVRDAYLIAILSEKKPLLIAAVFYATTRTLISSGSTRLMEYLGLNTASSLQNFMDSFDGLPSFSKYILDLCNSNNWWLYVICFGFVFVTRLAGLIGLIGVFRAEAGLRHLHILNLLIIVVFLAGYLAVSTSRFRAPFEPILMLYAAMGIHMLHRAVRKQRLPDL